MLAAPFLSARYFRIAELSVSRKSLILEHRHLVAGIDRLEVRLVLRAGQQVDDLMVEFDARLARPAA